MALALPGLQAIGFIHAFTEASDGDARTSALPPGVGLAKQVHGVHVIRVSVQGRTVTEADGLVALEGLGAGVLTADCVPILLADPRRGHVAAVHAGWRGTLAEVLPRAVEALQAQGSDPRDLHAAIGPAIRACCYAVSPDLQLKFAHAFGPEVSPRPGHLDLVAANRKQLGDLGIPSASIEEVQGCTRCAVSGTGHRYFSYRRDGEKAGRQLSWISSRVG